MLHIATTYCKVPIDEDTSTWGNVFNLLVGLTDVVLGGDHNISHTDISVEDASVKPSTVVPYRCTNQHQQVAGNRLG